MSFTEINVRVPDVNEMKSKEPTDIIERDSPSLSSSSTTSNTLRHRFRRSSIVQASLPTEELLVEKLDVFLSSIESRLDNFEQFFKFKSESKEEDKQDHLDVIDSNLFEDQGVELISELRRNSRRDSSSSLTSIKTYSINYLSTIHQRLNLIKTSLLKTSFTNLDYLYKTLDDQYNYLFSEEEDDEVSETSLSKEILSKKIITTIQYFDEKLLQVDDFIRDNKPRGNVITDDSTFNLLRFYNFNTALKNAELGYIHYYELPLGWRENKYIINGYRFSLKHSSMLRSIFHFDHNESMNIWTHLVGLFIMIYIAVWNFPHTEIFAMNSFKDNLVIYLFLAAAMKCLLSSVVWHTYSCFAHLPTRANCACVDYTGITVLITLSVISAEYCSLYNYPNLLMVYMVFSVTCGATGFLFNWSPYFDKPECRSFRIGFFVGLAFLGVSAGFCMAVNEGAMKTLRFFIPMSYKSFFWYWLGVVFYGGLIPERWRYDVIVDDENNCNHTREYDSTEVLLDNVHSGEIELEEIEEELVQIEREEIEGELGQIEREGNDDIYETKENPEMSQTGKEAELHSQLHQSKIDQDNEHHSKFVNILGKHFPSKPVETPYSKDFFSLWWVDYVLSSHNIWHVCVVLGVIGHYSALLEMFEQIDR